MVRFPPPQNRTIRFAPPLAAFQLLFTEEKEDQQRTLEQFGGRYDFPGFSRALCVYQVP